MSSGNEPWDAYNVVSGVVYTGDDRAVLQEVDTRLKLAVMSSSRIVVCGACNISCIHKPWPKGWVLLLGWRREALMPAGMYLLAIVK